MFELPSGKETDKTLTFSPLDLNGVHYSKYIPVQGNCNVFNHLYLAFISSKTASSIA